MAPYERLLGDAMNGDPELFARQDGIEAAWRVVEPVLGDVVGLQSYEPGSWGPAGAERLGAGIGGWRPPSSGDAIPGSPLADQSSSSRQNASSRGF